MTNRLPYETKGGHVSEGDTYSQMLEYLRMAEECAYTLGHLRKFNDDTLNGDLWIKVGENLKNMQRAVTNLAIGIQ